MRRPYRCMGKELVFIHTPEKAVWMTEAASKAKRDVLGLTMTALDGHGRARKKASSSVSGVRQQEELESFGSSLPDADLTPIQFERERLQLQGDQLEWMTVAREKDRGIDAWSAKLQTNLTSTRWRS